MGLSQTSLTSEILNIVASPNESPVFAKKLANSIINYWANGMSPQGGTVQATAVKSLLISGLIASLGGFKETSVAAKMMTNAIHSAWIITQISGGSHGTGGIEPTAPKSQLQNDIKEALDKNNTAPIFAKKFSLAIHKYSIGSTCYGSGTPPAVPPFVGISVI